MASRKESKRTQTKQNIKLDRGATARWIIQVGALNIDVSMRLLVGVLLAVLVQSGIIIVGFQRISSQINSTPEGEMTGAFNIAVIPFGQLDEDGRIIASTKGKRLAEQAYRVVEENFEQSGLNYDKRPPDDMDILTDQSTSEKDFKEKIEKLAGELKADWLVYGYLEDDNKKLALKVYLSAYRMPNARDLTDHYPVLAPSMKESVETNQAAYNKMLGEIAEQSESLAYFGLGVGYFSMDEIEESQRYFDLADAEGIDPELQKGIYLFQSKIKLVEDDYEGARADLEKALELDPNYSRALLGLGQLDYLNSRTSQICSNTIPSNISGQSNPQGTALEYQPFEDALRRFEEARIADDKDPNLEIYDASNPEAYIPIKADYYAGRVFHCMSIAGLEDRWIDAQCKYWSVIYFADPEQDWPVECGDKTYFVNLRTGSSVSRDLAARAYTDLALLNWDLGWNLEQQGDSDEAGKYYANVEDFFLEAIKISDHSDERALSHTLLADYYQKHDHCEEAKVHLQMAEEQYYDEYLKLNPNLNIGDFEEFHAEVQNNDDCF